MRRTTYALLTISTLHSLACGASVEDGDAIELAPDEDAADLENALNADTGSILRPEPDDNKTKIRFCWDDSAFPDDDRTRLYAEARWQVRNAIEEAYDDRSWVDVNWRNTCPTSGRQRTPIFVKDARASASASYMQLDFDFNNNLTACKPGSLEPSDPSNSNWKMCIRKLAVHEFGHVLGFDHEQDAHGPGGMRCPSGRHVEVDVDDSSLVGDLHIGDVDPYSVMGYCWDDHTDRLTPQDEEMLKALFGEDGRTVQSGQFYALGAGSRFVQIQPGTHRQIFTNGLDRSFQVERVAGPGDVAYGDQVRIKVKGEALCSTLGGANRIGVALPELFFTSNPYDEGACRWSVEQVPGTSTDRLVDVNDPVRLQLKAPVPEFDPNNHTLLGYDGYIDVRFLGPFNGE